MKKIILLITAFTAAVLCFGQNVRSADWYVQAETLSQKTIDLQAEGYYEESISAAKEAVAALDSAILEAAQLLMQKKTEEARLDADKVIETSKKIGAASDPQFKEQFDGAEKQYQDAQALLAAAAEVKTSEEDINGAYSPIIEEFTAVTQAVTQINNSYFTRETQKSTALIMEAKSRYTDLTNKKVILAGSPDGAKVNASINAADADLQQNNYSGVETNVKSAQDLMSSLEKAFGEQQAAVKKQIDEATARFATLKAGKTITEGSAEDKNISSLLTAAQTAYTEGTFTTAAQNAANANNAMTAAETAYKNAQQNAQKALAEAEAKQKELNGNGILPVQGADNANVTKLIADATAALKTGDTAGAKKNADEALAAMNAIEQNYTALQNSVQQLITQAKSGQKQLEEQYPEITNGSEYAAISADISSAEKAFDEKAFEPAQQSAQAALDKIAQFKSELETLAAKAKTEAEAKASLYTDEGKYKVLPKYYTVVSRVPISLTDCMWRIAQFSFIYGDKNQWQPIYDLNQKNFPKPGNPNLIYPGQVLEIPSLKGEQRDGMYDPKIQYIDFAEADKAAQ